MKKNRSCKTLRGGLGTSARHRLCPAGEAVKVVSPSRIATVSAADCDHVSTGFPITFVKVVDGCAIRPYANPLERASVATGLVLSTDVRSPLYRLPSSPGACPLLPVSCFPAL